MTAFTAWLAWQAGDDPLGFGVSAAFVRGLPVLAAWGMWLGRRTAPPQPRRGQIPPPSRPAPPVPRRRTG